MDLLVNEKEGDLVFGPLDCLGVLYTGLIVCRSAEVLLLWPVSLAGVGEWPYVGELGSFSSVSVV